MQIKRVRELGAANAVAEARDAVAQARDAVTEAETKAQDFGAFRTREEKRLFEDIRGQGVKVEDIDEMKFKVEELRAREQALLQEISDKQEALAQAQSAQETAQEAHREAQKALQKFQDFVDAQRAEAQKEIAAHEEAEVEEVTEAIFAVRMQGGDP